MCVFFACFSVEIMHSINVRKFSKNWNFALTKTDNPLFDVLLKMTAYNGNVRHFYAAAAVVRVFEWSTPFWNVEFLFHLFSFSFLFFSFRCAAWIPNLLFVPLHSCCCCCCIRFDWIAIIGYHAPHTLPQYIVRSNKSLNACDTYFYLVFHACAFVCSYECTLVRTISWK